MRLRMIYFKHDTMPYAAIKHAQEALETQGGRMVMLARELGKYRVDWPAQGDNNAGG